MRDKVQRTAPQEGEPENYVHQAPLEAELAAIRRSGETGLPYGAPAWVEHLAGNRSPTLRSPRGRPRKGAEHEKSL